MLKNLLRILVIATVLFSMPYQLVQAKENKATFDYSFRDGIECYKIEDSALLINEQGQQIKEKLISEKRLTEMVTQIREMKFDGRVKRSKKVLLIATEKPMAGEYKPVEKVVYATNERSWLDNMVVNLSLKTQKPYQLVSSQKKNVPVGEKKEAIIFVAILQREL